MGYAFSGFSLCSIGDDPTRYEISDNLAVHYNKNVTGHNVIMQIDKGEAVFDIVRLVNLKVITVQDLDGFSDGLIGYVNTLGS